MAGFSASPAQRKKVKDEPCIVCLSPGKCDPAHVVPRSLGGCDDEACVVALCRRCHTMYDKGGLDLLPFLAAFRREQAHAVLHLGIAGALRRLTNEPHPEIAR